MPKRYLVVPRTTKKATDGVVIDGKTKSFNGKTAMYIKDKGQADEIVATQGISPTGTHELIVHEDDKVERYVRDGGHTSGGIHHYHWGSTRAFRDGWDRIFGKE